MIQSLTNFAATGFPIVETAATALTRQVYDQDNNLVAELKAEAYNGHAEIDYAPILHTMFLNQQTHKYQFSTFARLLNDFYLSTKAKIGGTYYTFRRALEATNDFAKTKIINYSDTLPTTIPMNDICLGYPKYFSFYASGNDTISVNGSSSPITYTPEQGIYTIEILNAITDMHFHSYRDGVFMGFRVAPTPEHPFYVRWINRYGGWETFMFECNQKYTRQLKANEYYEKYQAEGVKTNYHKEGVEIVEVSSGIVSQKVFNELAMLKFSPIIQLYDAMSGTWTDIQVDKGDDERYSNQPSGEMIISFVLPEIQILK
jgi:hypothetical protein